MGAMMPDDHSEFRQGYAEIGDVRFYCVEAGDGPLIILLHGFPEFWFDWRQQIRPLAAAGFRVVAPRAPPDASHWVHHDEPERVTQLLIDFFGTDLPTQ